MPVAPYDASAGVKLAASRPSLVSDEEWNAAGVILPGGVSRALPRREGGRPPVPVLVLAGVVALAVLLLIKD